jgi:hypothetical protein
MTRDERNHMATVLSLMVRGMQGDEHATLTVQAAQRLYSVRVWDALERAAAKVARIRVSA